MAAEISDIHIAFPSLLFARNAFQIINKIFKLTRSRPTFVVIVQKWVKKLKEAVYKQKTLTSLPVSEDIHNLSHHAVQFP